MMVTKKERKNAINHVRVCLRTRVLLKHKKNEKEEKKYPPCLSGDVSLAYENDRNSQLCHLQDIVHVNLIFLNCS